MVDQGHLSTEETPLPVPVQESKPVITDSQKSSDDHPDELPVMSKERTEEEDLHLPVAESGTLLDQKKSNTELSYV